MISFERRVSLRPRPLMKEIRYIWAINEAIKEEMERDENVILNGEHTGTPGGSFGASRGLYDRFRARAHF